MRRRDYGACDLSQVDDLAVEFAYQGTPMRLNRDERVALVRRLGGHVSPAEIARRCHGHLREIERTLVALGAKACPACRQLIFDTDGVLDRHVDWRLGPVCGMSGRDRDDRAAAQRATAARSMARLAS